MDLVLWNEFALKYVAKEKIIVHSVAYDRGDCGRPKLDKRIMFRLASLFIRHFINLINQYRVIQPRCTPFYYGISEDELCLRIGRNSCAFGLHKNHAVYDLDI